ncbi:MAG: adenylate/guanylate cyclase domain-containing protein [Acidimicrobiales bacterium]
MNVHYTEGSGVEIAYCVYGDRGPDIVLIPGLLAHLDFNEEIPYYRPFIHRLREAGRLIVMDKRGCGLSDRSHLGTPEQQVDDVLAVMDATSSERPLVVGAVDGGPIAMLLAATQPARVASLVLYGSGARFVRSDDYPPGRAAEDVSRIADAHLTDAGRATRSATLYRDAPPDSATRTLISRWLRNIATPRMWASMQLQHLRLDVRAALGLISCPTLVIHNSGDSYFPVAGGRYLADHIAGARFAELAFDCHCTWSGSSIEAACDEIIGFTTGLPPGHSSVDRSLATVMFIDVVDSTRVAAQIGDHRWRSVLDDLDRVTADVCRRLAGRVVKSTGDGALAIFDGPGRAVTAALQLREALRSAGAHLRIGIHTGEVEVRGDDVGGLAVHLAARIQHAAGSDEVWVSRTVTDLTLGSAHHFVDAGLHQLKGFESAPWQLFRAETAT